MNGGLFKNTSKKAAQEREVDGNRVHSQNKEVAAWKKKEKVLNPKEAIQMAQQELAPFWRNSEPLFAAVGNEEDQTPVRLYPISKRFLESPWLIFQVDPTEPRGMDLLHWAQKIQLRYQPHQLQVVVILIRRIPALNRLKDYLPWLERHFSHSLPWALDSDGMVAQALKSLQMGQTSDLFLMSQGKCLRAWNLSREASTWESELQSELRRWDAGTAYPLPFKIGLGESLFSFDWTTLEALKVAQLKLQGKWDLKEGALYTKDGKASLSLQIPEENLYLLLKTPLERDGYTRIRVLWNGETPQRDFWGTDLFESDEGGAELRVNAFRLYSLLNFKTARAPGNLELHFLEASKISVWLFGMRGARSDQESS